MANLDVSDVLTDPDFMNTDLVCERNVQTVGADGRAVNATTLLNFAGVVTNPDGDTLLRIPDGERISGNIMVHTRFALDDGTAVASADVIQFGGRRYTVMNVNIWSHFGRGFVIAICDLIPLSG